MCVLSAFDVAVRTCVVLQTNSTGSMEQLHKPTGRALIWEDKDQHHNNVSMPPVGCLNVPLSSSILVSKKLVSSVANKSVGFKDEPSWKFQIGPYSACT